MYFNNLIAASLFLASGSLAQYYGSGGSQSSYGGGGYQSAYGGGGGSQSSYGSGGYQSAYGGGGGSWSSSVAAPAAPSSAVNAQASGSCSAPQVMPSTPPNTVSVQVVQVSNSNGSSLTYYPDQIQAAPGSMVQFQFYPKNHTVTQSTFANPCVPISKIMPNVTGIKSGFMPITPNLTSIPTFTIMVNDTSPIWIYCGQVGHCEKGMAMVINQQAGSNKTLDAYKAAAALLPINGTASTVSSIASAASSTSAVVFSSAVATSTTTLASAVGTTSSAPVPTFTGAAARDLGSMYGVTGAMLAGLAFLV